MRRHPKETDKSPDRPFPSAETWAQEGARVKAEQRKSSGGLTDDSKDAPVRDTRSFKNLRG